MNGVGLHAPRCLTGEKLRCRPLKVEVKGKRPVIGPASGFGRLPFSRCPASIEVGEADLDFG
jgi:hypothetical protein